jgi:hypothetical protein
MELARRWNEQPVSSEQHQQQHTGINSGGGVLMQSRSSSSSVPGGWGINGSSSSGGTLNGSSFLPGSNSSAFPITFSTTSMNQLASQYARARAIATTATNAADPENDATYAGQTALDGKGGGGGGGEAGVVMKVSSATLKSLSLADHHRSSPMRALRSSSAGGSEHLRIGGGLLNGGGLDEPVTVPFGSASSSSSSMASAHAGRGVKADATMKDSLSPGIVSEDVIANLAKMLI